MKLYQISEPSPDINTLTVGIDLGTTNSLIGFYDGEKVKIVPDKNSFDGIIPSVVAYKDGEFKVGYEALGHDTAIKSVKKLLGKDKNDPAIALYNIDDKTSGDEIVKLKFKEQTLSPVEISAEILKYLKKNAEEFTGKKITKAVITVPAHFDDASRSATKNAAKIAGLQVLRILNEPTAAAIAYGLHPNDDDLILVYDLGGGTFDVSVLKRNNGIMTVLATGGDNQLGGDDFDLAILEFLYQKAELIFQKDTSDGLEMAANIKKYLTDNPVWSGEFLTKPIIITRTEIVEVCQILIDRTIRITRDVLFAAKLRAEQISQVILAGGLTRMPAIQFMVEKLFLKPVLHHINPDQVVVIGATLQANALTNGGHILVDVVPLSLGIELLGGIVETIIERNTPIPTIVQKYYTTYKDNQTGFKIHVVQGKGDTIAACRSLGKFELSGLPPKPAGEVKLEVTFKVDSDGILFVSARELESGKSCEIQVKPSYGFEN
jgi:molecular chaperone HscA